MKPIRKISIRDIPLPAYDPSRPECPKDGYPLDEKGQCENCMESSCRTKEQEESWIKAMGGIKYWREYTSTAFKKTPGNANALTVSLAFDPKKDNMYIFGTPGAGKSHLAAIARRRWVIQGTLTKTCFMSDLHYEMREIIKDAHAQRELVAMLVRHTILSLEDLGAAKDSDFTTALLFDVVDGRYRAGRNGLIITTNFSPEELKQRLAAFDGKGRIVSRLREMCSVFDLSKERDFRLTKK